MKKFLVVFSLITLFAACGKTKNQPDSPAAVKVKRPVGEPLAGGITVTKVLGPEGGSISSKDGALSIEVPPGALKGDITFSIQPLSNTLQGSDAPSFKVLPEQADFQKPLT